MSRKQRLRVCGNLIQLFETTRSKAAARIYKHQLTMTASKLQRKKQSQKTTA